MASESGTEAAGVIGELFAEPQHFDFFQAVRVLEAFRPLAARVGEGREPAAEAVRFRATPGLAFPSSDVAGVARGDDGGPPEMTVAFLGLGGVGGPLPHSFSEWVMYQARAGDKGPRDFLDLFNHRLVSLLYRARARYRPSLARVPANETPPGRWIESLVGLGMPELRREETALPYRSILGYAALFATETRSGMGLECVLASHFGARARVVPFTGGWIAIEPDDWTRIGITGGNNTLGSDAVLGRRAWDAASGFEVELGPLTLDEYERFLPDGAGFAPLCALVRFWAGAGPAFTIRLQLLAAEVPDSPLGAGARLGRTSWLSTRPRDPGDDAGMRLDPARHGME